VVDGDCRVISGKIPRLFLIACLAGFVPGAVGQSISRTEALRIAESYVQHRWQASPKNVFHGKDAQRIEVHTPDRDGGHGTPLSECWRVDSENIGVAYKWGGNDTPQSFDAGIMAGKAAGDVYTLQKRRLDDSGVSNNAVGVDCSGFICRCWKLRERHSTHSLGKVCRDLSKVDALEPADIMNQPGGHVLLFVKWLDDGKKRALFYEAAPFSKTLASARDVDGMVANGFRPMRYRYIRG
jgi:hypothetical protein